MVNFMQFHSKGDDEDGGGDAASREPGQLKTGGGSRLITPIPSEPER